MKAINVLFSGGGPHLEFVEVEDDAGRGVNVGTWDTRKDGYQVLRITTADIDLAVPDLEKGGG